MLPVYVFVLGVLKCHTINFPSLIVALSALLVKIFVVMTGSGSSVLKSIHSQRIQRWKHNVQPHVRVQRGQERELWSLKNPLTI